MAGNLVQSTTAEPCRRCRDNPSVLEVRSEPLCQPCFDKYIHTKCIKRLDGFRANFADPSHQRKIALPLSFGVSSTTLLHILDLHYKTQKSKTGRTGFAIHAICIEDADSVPAPDDLISQAQKQYPDHHFSSLPLHHILHLVPKDAPLHSLLITDPKLTPTSKEKLAGFIYALPSATSRADVLTILRTRLIVEFAKLNGCDSILWGDSTTRLAEKTLAETARGRGFSLPWQVTNELSPLGINYHYPLRDVLKKEIVSYVDLSGSGLSFLIREPPTSTKSAAISSKNTTIDDLMVQYFQSVEQKFPSIVSNVVRTIGKFELPENTSSGPQCNLCGMLVPGGRFGIHAWGGDQGESSHATATANAHLCYGCTRLMKC